MTRGDGDSDASIDLGTERRQVTVVFCDLVGSSQLSQQLDPEDMRDLLRAYQACCVEAVVRHDGFVGQYLGDGVVAYFGYPNASEDAAMQAARAAAAMLRDVERVRPLGRHLRARAGIATGLAVVGDILGEGAARQSAVTGPAVVLAGRLQEIASPGYVVLAPTTRELLGGAFECISLGLQQLKNFDAPVEAWRLGRETSDQPQYESTHGGRQSVMVGRNRQLKLLRSLWQNAQEGGGHAALVTGEPGIGKSMLLRAFARGADASGGQVAILQCSPRHVESPLHPVVAYLRRIMAVQEGDSVDQRLSKLKAELSSRGLESDVLTLSRLLGMGAADQVPVAPAIAAEHRRETGKALLRFLRQAASAAPVALIVEDTHWADPSTHELLESLLAGDRSRLLIVASSRLDQRPPWGDAADVVNIPLPRLAHGESARIVRRITGHRLASSTVSAILKRADGVPLFLEELSRAAIDTAEQPSAPAIPLTLQDGLAARLGRMGSARATAQVASVVGREFDGEIVARIAGQSASTTAADLLALQSAGVIRKSDRVAGEYAFSHVLLQEAAYGSLLRNVRKWLHAKTASVLHDLRPTLLKFEPETFAHHFEQAEMPEQAAQHFFLAGERAQASGANIEAIAHLSRGLRVLGIVAESAEKAGLECRLQLALGQSSYVTNGPAHPDTVLAYQAAQNLVETLADESQTIVLYGIFAGYHFASKFSLAEEPARRALELAIRSGRRGDLCQAHRMLGYIAFFRGRHETALSHFQQLADAYRAEDHGPKAYQFGADCLVGTAGFHAVIESVRTSYKQAMGRAEKNCVFARKLNHPASLGWAYAAAAYVAYFGDQPQEALAISSTGLNYCRANNVASWFAHCRLFNLWAQARLGEVRDETTTELVRELQDLILATAKGNLLGLCLFRVVLAEILLIAGQAEQALDETVRALVDMESSGQRFFEPTVRLVHARAVMARQGSQSAATLEALYVAANCAKVAGAAVVELRALKILLSLELTEPSASTTFRQRVAQLQASIVE